MSKRLLRSFAVLTAIAMVGGAFLAVPAQAKKKKKKKKPPVPACATYVPGALGADADTSVVTDKATEAEPLTLTIATHEGLGFTSTTPGGDTGETSHVYQNLQVDTASAAANLFVRIEYAVAWDYDLFLRTEDGTAIAYEADFNPVPGTGLGGGENSSAEQGAGQIDGQETADCAGYTVDIASGISAGGDVTLTAWLAN